MSRDENIGIEHLSSRERRRLRHAIEKAKRTKRVNTIGVVLCENCDTPADRNLIKSGLSWNACAPCCWGEASSFNPQAVLLVYEYESLR